MFVIIRRDKRERQYWVHPMNLTRRESSVVNRFQQLKDFPDRFFELYRMTPVVFQYLLNMVGPRIRRQDTQMRKAIDPETRLCVTLHFLACGLNLRNLAYIYGLGRKTVSDIIYDCCEALWAILSPVYLKPPSTIQEWELISQRLVSKNNMICRLHNEQIILGIFNNF